MTEPTTARRKPVRITAVQLHVAYLDAETNRRRMVEFATDIGTKGGTDLLMFPELSNSGYVKGREKEFGKAYWDNAETIPGPTTDALGSVACQYGFYIIVGLNERHPVIPGTFYNSAVLIGKDGNVIGVHHKVHIPGQEKHFFIPGNTIEVYKTEVGTIGMQVCGDLLYPETARIQALKGAEIICVTFNSPFRPGSIPKQSLEQMACIRAWENKLFVATCNRVGTENELNFFGRSVIAGPSADVLAIGEDEKEATLSAELHLDRIIEERAFMSVFRDRRPELYCKIVEPLCPGGAGSPANC